MTRRHPILLAAIATLGTGPLIGQSVIDPALRVEIVVQGLASPTSIAFLSPPFGAPGEFLVLQKDDGRVLRFGGASAGTTVLDAAVHSASERGLLGIATDPDFVDNRFVYLYYTESSTGADTSDPASPPLGNRVY
ncbi:MAG TPA: PQQ-dependent sugar dehydrogenase, partial [Candidatus Polarisedimenticolia bacterium]|nr:PQQ-dependent sugar dehydrogenase [Candidatus Polarisedimenticolia bacterium]